ncbi:MAG: DUF4350 domain-containing protein [Sphingobacteriaceae bacterium]|nr:MAG: DUF4350 domain-containing protein [Sphingobacteriaceae bacterium]
MKDFKYYIIGACLLLTIYVVIEYNKPVPANWQPTLRYDDKIPFGTYVFYHQLNDVFPGADITRTNKSVYSLFKQGIEPGNYIIIANEVKLSKVDFNELVNYIKEGNNVFITAFGWDGYFNKALGIEVETEGKEKNKLVNFTNPRLKQPKYYGFDKEISERYFSKFDTVKATVLGINSGGHSNYLSFKYGKGNLFICANPQLFTNYSLLSPQGKDYAEKAISYLPVKQNIYWDQHQNHDIPVDQSPMRVIFENPSLKYAYYLALITLMVFLIFEAKRRQRIIPVIEPLKNSTLDFVKVVGKVYYDKRDNANIAVKKILYLQSYLRERYQLKTGKMDHEFADTMANKTGVHQSLTRELVDHINYVYHQQNITDHELIILNQLIEKFYAQA